MSAPIAVLVAGAEGKMGRAVCEAVEASDDTELAGRADPALGVSLADALAERTPDVVVDFTTPDSALANAAVTLDAGADLVIGTTGFDLAELGRIAAGSGRRAFAAPNFAIGAVLMMVVAQQIAPHMPECEIVELHNPAKLDRPSGTAARTAELIAAAGGNVHEPIHSIRLPGVVAHQEVVFGGEGQTLTVRHDSLDRRSFMPGVLLAVRRVGGLPDALTVGLEKLL